MCFVLNETFRFTKVLNKKCLSLFCSMWCLSILLKPQIIEDYTKALLNGSTKSFYDLTRDFLINGYGISFLVLEPIKPHDAFAAECTPCRIAFAMKNQNQNVYFHCSNKRAIISIKKTNNTNDVQYNLI